MTYSIQNEEIAISVSTHGAELKSLVNIKDNCQMLWQGDPRYWEGQSPILFPTVGRVFNDAIQSEGQNYPMPKHGLVRNMDFSYSSLTENSLTLSIGNSEETLRHYPYPFLFSVRYSIEGKKLTIDFEIKNPGSQVLPFNLGAHPALCIPQFSEDEDIHGYLSFDIQDSLFSNGLRPGGYLWPKGSFPVELNENQMLPLTNHTFDCDTIIDSRGLARACTLLNKQRKPIALLNFNSPILALWAPFGGKAPFVCIEPWWGCCDEAGYVGEFAARPWTNLVAPDETSTISYSITLL